MFGHAGARQGNFKVVVQPEKCVQHTTCAKFVGGGLTQRGFFSKLLVAAREKDAEQRNLEREDQQSHSITF
jgi:hypothetical protein